MVQKFLTLIVSVCLILVLGVLPFLAACPAPALPEEEPTITPMKLRLGSCYGAPEVDLSGTAAKMWGEMITERTNGAITFDYSWGGALGAPPQYIEMVRTGVLDVGVFHAWLTPSKLPLALFEYVFPFGPTDPVMVVKAKEQIREEFPQFAEDAANQNCILIANPPGCTYQFLSKEPINSLDDFKGQKCMLIGTYFGRWLSPTGAAPLVTTGFERYTMLQTGVATIDLLPLDLQYNFKVEEQAPYSTKADVLLACWVSIYMNLDTFNKLSPEVQKIFIDTGKELNMYVAEEMVPSWTEKIYKEWKEEGVVFSELPAEDKQKWASLIDDIPAEWAADMEATGRPGWEIVKRYQEITTELGYEWSRTWGVKK